MDAFTAERIFRLSTKGVDCDASGLRVGGIDLLARETGGWQVREQSETDGALFRLYGFAVETSAKRAGLRIIAIALTNGELARAQIAALLLQLPDPPSGASVDNAELASGLAACGLLKADLDWDAKHPRTGTPPNRAWFANKPKEVETNRSPKTSSTWPPREVNSKIRDWLEEIAGDIVWRGVQALIGKVPALEAFAAFVEGLGLEPANEWEVRMEQQIESNFSAPKDLEELETRPEGDIYGYERHHIVEQNASNLAKENRTIEREVAKFGREAIEDDSNIVWIPRLRHELVTAKYNSVPQNEPTFSRYRVYINTLDFGSQRQAGLDALREVGVLK